MQVKIRPAAVEAFSRLDVDGDGAVSKYPISKHAQGGLTLQEILYYQRKLEEPASNQTRVEVSAALGTLRSELRTHFGVAEESIARLEQDTTTDGLVHVRKHAQKCKRRK